MSPKKALQTARALLNDPTKWVKGTYNGDYGTHCLIGAVRAVVPADDFDMVMSVCRATLESCIKKREIFVEKEEWPSGPTQITDAEEFNDLPQTTHAHVLEVLDCAIAETSDE